MDVYGYVVGAVTEIVFPSPFPGVKVYYPELCKNSLLYQGKI